MSRKVILLSLFCSNDIFSECCFKPKVDNNLSIKGNKSKKSKGNKKLEVKKEEEERLRKVEEERLRKQREENERKQREEEERKQREEEERKQREENERKQREELEDIIKLCDCQLDNASKYANIYNTNNSRKALNNAKSYLGDADIKLNGLITLKSNTVNVFKDKIKRLNERYEYISKLIANMTVDISEGEKGYTAFLREDRIVIFSKEEKQIYAYLDYKWPDGIKFNIENLKKLKDKELMVENKNDKLILGDLGKLGDLIRK